MGVAKQHLYSLLDSLNPDLGILRKENKQLICRDEHIENLIYTVTVILIPVGSLLCSTKIDKSALEGWCSLKGIIKSLECTHTNRVECVDT